MVGLKSDTLTKLPSCGTGGTGGAFYPRLRFFATFPRLHCSIVLAIVARNLATPGGTLRTRLKEESGRMRTPATLFRDPNEAESLSIRVSGPFFVFLFLFFFFAPFALQSR